MGGVMEAYTIIREPLLTEKGHDLKEKHNLSYVFIAHDLEVVRHIADRVAVMYLGMVMQLSPAKLLLTTPYHPYTEALLSAIPIPDPTLDRTSIRLSGAVPSALAPPSGCRFHTRCPQVFDRCRTEAPAMHGGNGCQVRCHLLEESN